MSAARHLWGVVCAAAVLSAPAPDRFTDVTREAGIAWRHFNGESPDRFLIETSSGGAGIFDFDNDGLLDIYLVNGGETPRGRSASPVRNALYRNRGDGRFEDVAEPAGVARIAFYGMGVAAADYDNDGFDDLYVTGFPSSALYRNRGDRTFENVTSKAGVSNAGEWGASAAWIDYDRDGRLDLFVCNYAQMSFSDPKPCEFGGKPVYCDQRTYEGSRSKLFRNKGDGTFEDVSAPSGVSRHMGRAFGVISIDANDDGWPDLFVASDATPNLLLLNRRDGTFQDAALEAEVAYDENGRARSGMGVDAGDVDGDGLPDFVITNFHDEHHVLHINAGPFSYRERTMESGLAALTRPYVGWGVRLFDHDNDGALDLLIANGHVTDSIEQIRRDVRYRQLPLLLGGDGKGRFHDLKAGAGPVFSAGHTGRGLATGDLDHDGDMDAILVRLGDTPMLLRNNAGQNRSWVGLRLEGARSNRNAIGAKVTVRAAGRAATAWVTSGGSFLGSHDRRVLIGLGEVPAGPLTAEIVWPSGLRQTVPGLAPNRYHTVREP